MNLASLQYALGLGVVVPPALLLLVQGIAPLASLPLSEKAIARWTASCVLVGLASSIGILISMLATGGRFVPFTIGTWSSIPEQHYHFQLKFGFDRLSVPFVTLSFVLVGLVGAFASRYLHRESGFSRFFLLHSVFLLGMVLATAAGTIETLFIGWELVGLSSTLLVAFYQERPFPVISGQRIWSVYRLSDAAFILAAVALHHVSGEGDFSGLMGKGPWPQGEANLSGFQALAIGLLLLLAAAGKSALVPFSGWLPRAMEGPTPSSAIFYGALSVHLGAFLLLRVSPILDASWPLAATVAALGVATAVLAAAASRVQNDVKSALAYASVTQVGIITAEIGIGFRYLPLIHIIGHACLRTLQLLRAPSLLHDYWQLENALGKHIDHEEPIAADRWFSGALWNRFYKAAHERWYLDGLLDRYVVEPFMAFFLGAERLERRWTQLLESKGEREPDVLAAAQPAVEDA